MTSSDGAGNGFNYEDGTFSPQEVQDTIRAINADGGLLVRRCQAAVAGAKAASCGYLLVLRQSTESSMSTLPDNWTPTSRPQCQSWLGAQTTIQRWYLDPLLDNSGVDRTLRTVFTHDHFGPSDASTGWSLRRPAGWSLWDPAGATLEDGAIMGRPANQPPVRSDGGPTSWKVDVLTKDKDNNDVSYREFALEFQDLQLAYAWATIAGTNPPKTQPSPNPKLGWIDPAYAINAPSGSQTQARPSLVTTGVSPSPAGTQSVNYRNDPIAWRVGPANDMSYAFDSALKLAGNAPPNGDPFTPSDARLSER